MTAVQAVAALLFIGIMAYGLFGGADFGSGLWDLTAGNAKQGGPLRSLIDHSIGPVWEANHVWLIFVLVFLWTGFPRAFGAIVTTLTVPLAVAAVGITLRGSSFAFRKVTGSLAEARFFGAVFALSSVITPFFLGTVAGAVGSGRVPAAGQGDVWRSWTGPSSLLGGVLAVATCAYLAGVFLVSDAQRMAQPELVELLRHRVMQVGASTGLLAFGGIFVLRHDAPTLFHGLVGRGLVFIVASAVGGVVSLYALWARHFPWARLAAAAAVASVLAGWGAAQYPWVLVDELTLTTGAGANATIRALFGVGMAAIVIVVPSLVWLYRLVDSPPNTPHHP